MTGPEHYRKAELLIGKADGQDFEAAAHTLAAAQVHATLAQAAAVAMAAHPDGMHRDDYSAWAKVATHETQI